MAGVSFTLENLNKLEECIIKCVRKVQYQDKVIEYRSIDEMLKVRDLMRRCLGLVTNPSRIFTQTSKGLC